MIKKPYSNLVAGTMTWGVWGKNLNELQMVERINCCVENNITTFDHADIYGGYTTEKSFGAAFVKSKIDRQMVQFVSKCGIMSISENRNYTVKHYDYSAKHITNSVENSLKNLKTDYLDLLLLHRPSPLIQVDEVANTINKLKAEGKILDFGVSNFTITQTQLLQAKIRVDFNQIQISATHCAPLTDGTLDFMQFQNIRPMAWNPLGSLYKNNDNQVIRLKTILEKLTEKYSLDADVLLIAWLLKHPARILPIFGTTDLQRIKNLAKSLQVQLDLEDWFAIWSESMGKNVP